MQHCSLNVEICAFIRPLFAFLCRKEFQAILLLLFCNVTRIVSIINFLLNQFNSFFKPFYSLSSALLSSWWMCCIHTSHHEGLKSYIYIFFVIWNKQLSGKAQQLNSFFIQLLWLSHAEKWKALTYHTKKTTNFNGRKQHEGRGEWTNL